MITNGDTTGKSVTIPNLEPCTSYRFSVAAMNDAGTTGSYGDEVDGTTALAGKCTLIQMGFVWFINMIKTKI